MVHFLLGWHASVALHSGHKIAKIFSLLKNFQSQNGQFMRQIRIIYLIFIEGLFSFCHLS